LRVNRFILAVRLKIKKGLAEQLTNGKRKTEQDKAILHEISLLNRCLRKLTQSPDKWSEKTKVLMIQLFSKYKTLKQAYELSQDFKKWYDINNYENDKTKTRDNLLEWYYKSKETEIEEFTPVIKMIRKHEDEILNYFLTGHTSAGAERLNGKIQRFVSANYGTRDKDFSLYRIANYFS
jgi:transposase